MSRPLLLTGIDCPTAATTQCRTQRPQCPVLKEGKEHYGIIIPARRNVYELARRIASLLERRSAKDIKNQLWHI